MHSNCSIFFSFLQGSAFVVLILVLRSDKEIFAVKITQVMMTDVMFFMGIKN